MKFVIFFSLHITYYFSTWFCLMKSPLNLEVVFLWSGIRDLSTRLPDFIHPVEPSYQDGGLLLGVIKRRIR